MIYTVKGFSGINEAEPLFFWNSLVVPKCSVCDSHSVMFDSLQPQHYSLPGSSVHGFLQARILEWVAISFSTKMQ